jgi:diphthamide biosynthesis methyltransferase
MLYLIGLGLGNAKDISVKGLEIVKNAKEVYLEAYTSILTVGKDALVRLVDIYIQCLWALTHFGDICSS